MDWNSPRPFQHSTQSTFTQQAHGSAQPWHYYDEEEEEEVPELRRNSTRYAGRSAPLAIPSFKMEPSSNGGGFVAPQSLSSLSMPQLEESTEFQSFLSPSSGRFADSTYLSENQQLPLQQQEQQGEQLPSQFSGNFTPFPSAMATYYPPLAMPAPTSMLAATRPSTDYYSEGKLGTGATTRPAMDYYSEGAGFSTLHSAHCSVPTLPSNFGSLQRQQQLSQAILEDRSENFDNGIVHDTQLPITPTMDNYAEYQSLSTNTPPEYPPTPAFSARDKRGRELGAPFTEMATTVEPKFSPDKRKLCCVEGCKSQARAFNRCKRHGGSKRCSSPGCTKSVQSRGLCIRHGGGSRCQEVGCGRASQSRGRCKMHGGGRPCIVAGCEKKAHLKRLCRKHGGGAKCCITGCSKWAQRQGMCMTHSKMIGTQPSGLGSIGDSFMTEQNPSPPPSAPDSSPSLQFFSDNVPV